MKDNEALRDLERAKEQAWMDYVKAIAPAEQAYQKEIDRAWEIYKEETETNE